MSRGREDIASNSFKRDLWDPLGRLMAKAKTKREKAKERDKASDFGIVSMEENSHMELVPDASHLPQLSTALLESNAPTWQNTLDFIPESISTQPVLPFGSKESNNIVSIPLDYSTAQISSTATRELHSTQLLSSITSSNVAGLDTVHCDNSFNGSTQPVTDRIQLDWENWDDLVQEFGMQTGGSSTQPAMLGSGSRSKWV
jgi:hypothetical protein